MEFIFHVGLGKTGTTAIQEALYVHRGELLTQGIEYCGTLFTFDPRMRNSPYQGPGFDGPPINELDGAGLPDIPGFVTAFERLAKDRLGSSTRKLVVSNETMFASCRALAPLWDALREMGTLRIVIYVRNPADWLHSAYNQWGLLHKTNPGAVRPFREKAVELARWYRDVLPWYEDYPDSVVVRHYASGMDAVTDFNEILGADLPSPGRVNESKEDAEIFVRGMFNSRFSEPVMPGPFDQTFMRMKSGPPLAINEMYERIYERSSIGEIVAAEHDTLEAIAHASGIDELLTDSGREYRPPELAEIKDRVLDYLVEATIQQGERLNVLEDSLRQQVAMLGQVMQLLDHVASRLEGP